MAKDVEVTEVVVDVVVVVIHSGWSRPETVLHRRSRSFSNFLSDQKRWEMKNGRVREHTYSISKVTIVLFSKAGKYVLCSPFAKVHGMCVFNYEQTKNSVFNSYIIHSEVNCWIDYLSRFFSISATTSLWMNWISVISFTCGRVELCENLPSLEALDRPPTKQS